MTAVRLGRWRKPFDAEREADWICNAVDLKNVEIILSGAKGWPALDENYSAVATALSARAGRNARSSNLQTTLRRISFRVRFWIFRGG